MTPFQFPGFISHLFHTSSEDDDSSSSPRKGISSELAFITLMTCVLLATGYLIVLVMNKCSREGPLMAKVAALDKELFQVRKVTGQPVSAVI